MPTPTAAFAHPPVYSPWFTFATQAPWEPGLYEVQILHTHADGRYSFWDGKAWRRTNRDAESAYKMRSYATECTITRWRGIVPPSRPALLRRLLPSTATVFWMAVSVWLGFLLARAEGWL